MNDSTSAHALAPEPTVGGFDPNDVLVPQQQVKVMFGGISDMTLHRWLRREQRPFPPPIKLAGRNFWRLSEIRRYVAECEAASRSEGAEV